VIAADRITAKNHTAGRRNEVHDDIGRAALGTRHVSERDQTVEARLQGLAPRRDGVLNRRDLRGRCARVRLHGNGELGMIPPVARVIVAQNDQCFGIGRWQVAGGQRLRAFLNDGGGEGGARRQDCGNREEHDELGN
jgi:hypothetical protein